jgi:hypothetical protein
LLYTWVEQNIDNGDKCLLRWPAEQTKLINIGLLLYTILALEPSKAKFLFLKGKKMVVITFNNKNKIQYKDNFIL